MLWVVVAYLAVGYYYFHLTLRCFQEYDGNDTIILNSILALLFGPLLLLSIPFLILFAPLLGDH